MQRERGRNGWGESAWMLAVAILLLAPAVEAEDGDGRIEPGEDDIAELQRAAQNPMADLMSFPIQNNMNLKYGPLDGTQNVTNIQPVIPFDLTEDWLLISRTIMPLIRQPGLVPGQSSEFGLGDTTQSLFIGPSNPGRFIWGVGPTFLLRTATDDRLGSGKWGVGPSFVGLTVRGRWVVGALVQNIWSFAGDNDRSKLNQMLLQYFVNYNMDDGWYVSSAPMITANWKADRDNTWTVPLGAGVGRLFRIGKLPVNASVHGYYNVERPDPIGAEWTLRTQVQILLPRPK